MDAKKEPRGITTEKKSPKPAAREQAKPREKPGPKPKGDSIRRGLSFYIDSEVLSQLVHRSDKRQGQSKNDIMHRELALLWKATEIGLSYARKNLTRNEAKAILDVMNGTYWDVSNLGMMIGGGIAINIQDGITLEQLDRKWGFDGPALASKLAQLDRLSTLALLEWARLFWIHHDELDLDEHVNGFQKDE